MTYAEKLKDPRWQKKRLEILERDEWECKSCFNKDSTLHVHHKVYNKGKEPWDIDCDLLITLCEDCHNEESNMKLIMESLVFELKSKFLSNHISDIAIGFHSLENSTFQDITASALGWAISNKQMMCLIEQKYFDYLKVKYRDKDNKLIERACEES